MLHIHLLLRRANHKITLLYVVEQYNIGSKCLGYSLSVEESRSGPSGRIFLLSKVRCLPYSSLCLLSGVLPGFSPNSCHAVAYREGQHTTEPVSLSIWPDAQPMILYDAINIKASTGRFDDVVRFEYTRLPVVFCSVRLIHAACCRMANVTAMIDGRQTNRSFDRTLRSKRNLPRQTSNGKRDTLSCVCILSELIMHGQCLLRSHFW